MNYYLNVSKRTLANVCKAGLCFVVLTGCSSKPSIADVPLPNQQVANPQEYKLGPGDSITISVWRNPEISMTVPVRPDGKITTPLVEDMPASGKTPTELARDLEKALVKYVQQPIVTVIVNGFVGQYSQQIRVIGQASKPQALPFRRDMTVMDVLIAVGGMTDFAAGNRANIIRIVDGKQEKINVRLNDLLKDGDISANTAMMPGDVLVIPESFF